MRISTETQQILKNYAAINPGILLLPGNVLRTRTTSVFAEAKVAETFPREVGIHDISNFLSVMNLCGDPEVEFEEKFVRISDAEGDMETIYTYAGGSMVTLQFPTKMKPIPNDNIKFDLTEDQLAKVNKATSLLLKTEIKVVSDGKKIRIGTAAHKNENGNSFSMQVSGDPGGRKCNMVYNKTHINFMKGDYAVTVTPTFTMLSHKTIDLVYWLGVEPSTSSFGA
jgi:hypothetical protein